jgi:hypothetical protein
VEQLESSEKLNDRAFRAKFFHGVLPACDRRAAPLTAIFRFHNRRSRFDGPTIST